MRLWRGVALFLVLVLAAGPLLIFLTRAEAQSGGSFGGGGSRNRSSGGSTPSQPRNYNPPSPPRYTPPAPRNYNPSPPVIEAQSGGSFGGGGFRNRSSGGSTPSQPRNYNPPSPPRYTPPAPRNYNPSPPVIIVPGGGYNNNYNNGYNNGYSSNSSNDFDVVSLLIVVGVVGVVGFMIVSSMRRSNNANGAGQGVLGAGAQAGSAALKVQVMLLEGEQVKQDFQRIAESGDPSNASGLSQMLGEGALSILRRPERWAYGTIEMVRGSEAASAQKVAAWANEARSKFQTETTSRRGAGNLKHVNNYVGQAGGVYLVVTFAVAAADFQLPKVEGTVDSNEMRAALMAVSGVTADSLVSGEVVWTPDAENEFLTEDQALQLYPSLYHL
jgi:uncharacterized membrane protein